MNTATRTQLAYFLMFFFFGSVAMGDDHRFSAVGEAFDQVRRIVVDASDFKQCGIGRGIPYEPLNKRNTYRLQKGYEKDPGFQIRGSIYETFNEPLLRPVKYQLDSKMMTTLSDAKRSIAVAVGPLVFLPPTAKGYVTGIPRALYCEAVLAEIAKIAQELSLARQAKPTSRMKTLAEIPYSGGLRKLKSAYHQVWRHQNNASRYRTKLSLKYGVPFSTIHRLIGH